MTDANSCFCYGATELASFYNYPYGKWKVTVNEVPTILNISQRNSYGELYNFLQRYNIDVGILHGLLTFKNNSFETISLTLENVSDIKEPFGIKQESNPTLIVLDSIEDVVTKVTFCLEGLEYSTTNCHCDSNSTDYIDVNGKWDLIIENKVHLKNVSALEIATYLNNTKKFKVDYEGVIEFTYEFDYVVINYYWDAINGLDLDTRTSITNPPRNLEVGWDRQGNDLTYLEWSGDNTGSGTEAVLIKINDLKKDYPSSPILQILLKAFWYNTVNDGNFRLKFTTYKGGTMRSDGNFSFVNSNGNLIDSFTIQCHTTSKDHLGVPLGYLEIDLTNNRSTFNIAPNNNVEDVSLPSNL